MIGGSAQRGNAIESISADVAVVLHGTEEEQLTARTIFGLQRPAGPGWVVLTWLSGYYSNHSRSIIPSRMVAETVS